MSLVWEFFTKNGKSIAQCRVAECGWTKEIGKNMNVSFLKSHLATSHPEMFKQLKAKEEEKKKTKSPILTGIKNTIVAAFAKQSSSKDTEEPALKKSKDSPIIVSLGAKRPWSEDGEMSLQVNRAILEMMAADIQPLSLVQNRNYRPQASHTRTC
ncbi:hypothetical protein AAVH_16938 [Aphelenchoides avenae]|nr:hypothetical protein AAVH_16938 [Aphelenchus avenae]